MEVVEVEKLGCVVGVLWVVCSCLVLCWRIPTDGGSCLFVCFYVCLFDPKQVFNEPIEEGVYFAELDEGNKRNNNHFLNNHTIYLL